MCSCCQLVGASSLQLPSCLCSPDTHLSCTVGIQEFLVKAATAEWRHLMCLCCSHSCQHVSHLSSPCCLWFSEACLVCPAGVLEFLDSANADGAALAIITSTASGAENIAVATSAALGDARTQKWPFFDCYQQPGWQERDSDEAEGSGRTSLHQSLHKRQAQVGVHGHQLGAAVPGCLSTI